MMRKLISIGFAINIIWCSIGVQVMMHDCIWCGGDRIEIVRPGDTEETTGSCCAEDGSSHHDCEDDGCCQSKLLKLTSGMASEDDFALRHDVRKTHFDALISFTVLQVINNKTISTDIRDDRGILAFSPPPAFLSPLRC